MAARTRKPTTPEWEWLSLIDADGPFLSKAALKSFYPNGLELVFDDEKRDAFRDEYARWTSAWSTEADVFDTARDRWVEFVLRSLLDWSDDVRLQSAGLQASSPNGTVAVEPFAVLDGDGAAPAAIVTVVDRAQNLRAVGTDGWSANAIDRMAVLLRETGVSIGLVTDGQWWALVSAEKDVTTASGVWDAELWTVERSYRDAFISLASFSSIAGGQPEKRLPLLFTESVASAEQITEALGDQVRRAVELVLQSMSDTHLRSLTQGDASPLPDDPKLVYEGAVTMLMRIVFLLFAEERGLLPEHDLYRSSYAIADLRTRLQDEATEAGSPEVLDHSWEAWHRLLAASNAVFNGVSYPDARMPAYGGSLFDPDRFPWLQATDAQGRLQVRLTDRAMLAVLRAVQTIEDGAMQLSFRDLDVEQIGYVYEGLLGYSAAYVTEVTVGLHGKAGFEPEIALDQLEQLAANASSPKLFGDKLVAHLKKTQEHAKARTAGQIAKAYGTIDADASADARTRLRHALLGDDELAARLEPFHALIRDDLRGFPYVVPAGGLVMTESSQRANTGTHYTPRSLAEEVVLHALEPLVYSPGPLDTENSDEWVLKSSAEILDLKVADIAAGSGAFLVAAARYLADRLLEARAKEGMDVSAESDLKRWAVREIVARCLYGADINGMAVEMCKLSLWLISMDPGKPFSFVDDRVFHGNSLLGVTTEAQLKAQHIYPQESMKRQLAAFDVDKDLEDAARLRRELASGQVDDADRMRSTRAKRALLAQSREVTAKLRDVADGIIAAGLLEGGKPGRKLEERYDELAEALRDAYPEDGSAGDLRRLATIIAAGLQPKVDTGEARWKPLHWILEAPDVIHDHGGFDAIIGNPPFLGGKKISSATGEAMRSWLVSALADGQVGHADLVAYFVLRAAALSRASGSFGLIATNTIAQGDTREVALQRLLQRGWHAYRAVQSRPWPSASANLEYAAVWATCRAVPATIRPVADDERVPKISSLLEAEGRTEGIPARLNDNRDIAYIGSFPMGTGFAMSDDMRAQVLRADPTSAEVIEPFLNGDDLNATPDTSATRWIVNFGERTESEARRFPGAWRHVEHHVHPERMQKDRTKYPQMVDLWWQYWRPRARLYASIRSLQFVTVIVLHSKHVMAVRVRADQVFSHALGVFSTDSASEFAFLSSSIHQLWAIMYGSTLGHNTVRYTPSDVYETLPRPNGTERMRELGEQLDGDRRGIMLRRQLGLTALYNLVNSPDVESDADVDLIRSIHVQIDVAVMEAYGWTDIPLDHGFHTYRQMERWTVSPAARVEILDRLLEENHRRAAIEAHLNPKKAKPGKSLEESEKPEGAMF
ncbi:Eco57I restriction-modification methylase domain-containing protein [Agromyces sp. NPDC058110]|uniref:Eco57I restriction-modification methylase domain-containing protein n=1 Tax=Agromyces sp. NPDC058110 TaxID=3346345 RepID=UPI0036DD1036